MRKYLLMFVFATFMLTGILAYAGEDEEFWVEKYNVATGVTTKESLGNIDEFGRFGSTKGKKGIQIFTGDDEGISLTDIIGDDSREIVKTTTVNPYSCIGFLKCTRYDGTVVRKTAFLVGPSIILTAAHNVYPDSDYKEYRFYPGYNSLEKDSGNQAPYSYALGVDVHVPTNYKAAYATNDVANREKYDYALVVLNKAIGNQAGYLGLAGYGSLYTESALLGKNIVTVGYPDALNHYMFRDKKPIKAFANEYMIATEADADVGQEGGPMLVQISGTYYVAGIYTGYAHTIDGKTLNCGRYVTRKIYELVKKYYS